jgi:hypothetical protein
MFILAYLQPYVEGTPLKMILALILREADETRGCRTELASVAYYLRAAAVTCAVPAVLAHCETRPYGLLADNQCYYATALTRHHGRKSYGTVAVYVNALRFETGWRGAVHRAWRPSGGLHDNPVYRFLRGRDTLLTTLFALLRTLGTFPGNRSRTGTVVSNLRAGKSKNYAIARTLS